MSIMSEAVNAFAYYVSRGKFTEVTSVNGQVFIGAFGRAAPMYQVVGGRRKFRATLSSYKLWELEGVSFVPVPVPTGAGTVDGVISIHPAGWALAIGTIDGTSYWQLWKHVDGEWTVFTVTRRWPSFFVGNWPTVGNVRLEVVDGVPWILPNQYMVTWPVYKLIGNRLQAYVPEPWLRNHHGPTGLPTSALPYLIRQYCSLAYRQDPALWSFISPTMDMTYINQGGGDAYHWAFRSSVAAVAPSQGKWWACLPGYGFMSSERDHPYGTMQAAVDFCGTSLFAFHGSGMEYRNPDSHYMAVTVMTRKFFVTGIPLQTVFRSTRGGSRQMWALGTGWGDPVHVDMGHGHWGDPDWFGTTCSTIYFIEKVSDEVMMTGIGVAFATGNTDPDRQPSLTGTGLEFAVDPQPRLTGIGVEFAVGDPEADQATVTEAGVSFGTGLSGVEAWFSGAGIVFARERAGLVNGAAVEWGTDVDLPEGFGLFLLKLNEDPGVATEVQADFADRTDLRLFVRADKEHLSVAYLASYQELFPGKKAVLKTPGRVLRFAVMVPIEQADTPVSLDIKINREEDL